VTRLVVCDTGPLLHLSEAGALHLLQYTGRVLIPDLVAGEFEQNAQGWKPPQWITIKEMDKNTGKQADNWKAKGIVDPGEAHAIALAVQLKADWLLTDDAKARQFAETLGLEVHGSIGLLLWSLGEGFIQKDQAYKLLDGLAHSSLWVSERVLDKARQTIDLLSA
jgi:predicted nucleic acid-binding protein